MLQFVAKESEHTGKQKRKRKDESPSIMSSISWVDKHRPMLAKDLVLHHTKINSIKDWLRRAIDDIPMQPLPAVYQPMVLILCGKSGCGKSTAVELICQEKHIHLQSVEPDMSSSSLSLSTIGYSNAMKARNAAEGSLTLSLTAPGAMSLQEESDEYLLRCKYSSLSLQPVKPAPRHTSTQPHSSTAMAPTSLKRLASAHIAPVTATATSSGLDTSVPARPVGGSSTNTIAIIHDPVPLTASSSGSKGFQSTSTTTALSDLILSLRIPVVVILSDVHGPDSQQHDIEAYLPSYLRHMIRMEAVYCPAVTEKKTAKVLSKILAAEMLPYPAVSSEDVDNIASSSLGDLRQAINQLQFLCLRKHVTTNTSSMAAGQPMSRSLSGVSTISTLSGTSDSSNLPSHAMRRSGAIMSIDEDESDDEFAPVSMSMAGKRSYSNNSHRRVCSTARAARQQHKRPSKTIDSDGHGDGHGDGQAPPMPDAASHGLGMQSVDESYSSLQSVAKLSNAALNATGRLLFDPDKVFARSDLSADTLTNFLQWNCIGSLEHSQRYIDFMAAPVDPFDELSSDMLGSGGGVVDQMEFSLALYSDIDLMSSRRFNPSIHLDRSDPCFPDEYVCSIASRIAAVARGIGAKEAIQAGRERGAPHSFFGIRRPAYSNFRQQSNATRRRIKELREALIQPINNGQPPTPSTHRDWGDIRTSSTIKAGCDTTTAEVALSVIPALRGVHAAVSLPPAISISNAMNGDDVLHYHQLLARCAHLLYKLAPPTAASPSASSLAIPARSISQSHRSMASASSSSEGQILEVDDIEDA